MANGSSALGVVAVAAMVAGGVYALGPLPGAPHVDLRDLFAAEADSGGSGRCDTSVGDWSDEQIRNARTISRVGREMDMPDRAVVIALATAMQESRLHNTTDHPPGEDSRGLFQQRPSQGWGTVAQVMDPEHAARSFFLTLAQIDGWEDMPVTVAAQRVQRSAFPDAYAQHEREARRLQRALAGCR